MAGPTCGPYCAAKAAVNNLMYSYAEALKPYGAGATVLCPGNINSNIGNAEKYRPANLKNTGYHVTEGTMKHLRSVHAMGIDPVELAEILKEGIENERIIVLPDHNYDSREAEVRSFNETIEEYALTRAEREARAAKRMEEMRKAAPAAGDDKSQPPMWAVPEGAEAFGQARKDLDWIDPSKRM